MTATTHEIVVDEEIRRVHRTPGSAERDPKGHRRRLRAFDLVLGVGVPAIFLALWQTASSLGWVDSRLYPAPTEVVTKATDLWGDGVLWSSMFVSMKRMVYGFGLGASVGIGAGFAMGIWRPLRAAFEPFLNVLYTVPKLALLPVFLTALGFGEPPMVAIVAVTVFFFVWISTLAAVMAVSDGYRDSAKVMGVSRWNMFRHVLFPASLPQVVVGCRIGAGVSVLVLIGVELVIAQSGLGYLIQQGRSLLLLSQTFVGIVLAALLGFLFSGLIRLVGHFAVPWAADDNTPARL